MRFQMQENTLRFNGAEMDYAVFGRGERPMVLIPGLSLRPLKGSAGPLAHSYRLFTKNYRVYVFDKKAPLPPSYTVEEMAEDLAEAMVRLGIRDADILGISQGGMIAQYLALNHPELVRRLALGVTLSRNNDTVRAVIDRWVDMAQAGDYAGIVREIMEKMYSEKYIKKYGFLFPIILKTQKMNDPARFVTMARACLSCDTYDRLPELRCPVLVLGGKRDQIVTAQASEEIAQRLNCPLYLYEDLGHSAYEEGKDFNKRVYDFFKAGE